MSNRREILKEYYVGILRKVATWVAVVAVCATTMAPLTTQADQESIRTATISDSNISDTAVSYQVAFKNTTLWNGANAIKTIRLQFCDNASGPIYNTACTLPAGMTRGTTVATDTDNGTTFTNPYTAATNGTSDVLLTAGTANTVAATDNVVLKLSGFTNSSYVGELYVRAILCNDASCVMGAGTNMAWGGFAYDTTNQFSVTGNVQEDLKFCIGATIPTPCSSIGAATVALNNNPMTTGAVSYGSAVMDVSTNGSGGYIITCIGTGFTDNTADTITAAPGGGAVAAINSQQFGMTLRGQTSGLLSGHGADPSGGTSALVSANYNSLNSTIAYDTSAGGVQVAGQTVPQPTAFTQYTILYAADIDNLAKPGQYSAKQTYIATATF